jgi:hypothetical protein
MEKVGVGLKVRDRVTGFEGIVTGRAEYITGCAQVLVQPKVDQKGAFVEGRWVDETRVEVLDYSPAFANETPNSGPDVPAPVK